MMEHQLLAGKVTTIEASYLDEIRVSSIQHSSRIQSVLLMTHLMQPMQLNLSQ